MVPVKAIQANQGFTSKRLRPLNQPARAWLRANHTTKLRGAPTTKTGIGFPIRSEGGAKRYGAHRQYTAPRPLTTARPNREGAPGFCDCLPTNTFAGSYATHFQVRPNRKASFLWWEADTLEYTWTAIGV